MAKHLDRIRLHMEAESERLRRIGDAARVFDNATNRGREAEEGIGAWLRARFAPHYGLSTGEIIDSFDSGAPNKSRQQDWILHRNTAEAARFVLPSGFRMVPVECVAAVVEVKLTLSKQEFDLADKAASETANLRLRPSRSGKILNHKDGGVRGWTSLIDEEREAGVPVCAPTFRHRPLAFALFAFGGAPSIDAMREWMQHSTISIVCCLSAGCVVRQPSWTDSSSTWVSAGANDALWHFSESVWCAVKEGTEVVDSLAPDFSRYASYAREYEHVVGGDHAVALDSVAVELTSDLPAKLPSPT